MGAKAGDRIVVESERVGIPSREGAILEVVESATGHHYRVRWDDGHEGGFWPSAGSARIVPAEEAGQGGPSAVPDTGESRPVVSR
ncbi:MAG TPA: DUF1918 domain-containing protein [Candidatus Acidoferrales bacterium]|nr:DUF1918 domain-containing protein [Candidatus Acidoferrales bacterium]